MGMAHDNFSHFSHYRVISIISNKIVWPLMMNDINAYYVIIVPCVCKLSKIARTDFLEKSQYFPNSLSRLPLI